LLQPLIVLASVQEDTP